MTSAKIVLYHYVVCVFLLVRTLESYNLLCYSQCIVPLSKRVYADTLHFQSL